MTINAIMAALVAELAADGIPDVLNQRFTFAAMWNDLCRIAGEAVPRDVAAVLDRSLDYVPVTVALSPMGEYTPVYAD